MNYDFGTALCVLEGMALVEKHSLYSAHGLLQVYVKLRFPLNKLFCLHLVSPVLQVELL